MDKIVKDSINFFNDDTVYYAASLSFFTIFSLLPILSLLIFIISFLPMFEVYTNMIISHIIDILNPTHSKYISINIKQFLSNIDQLGSIGIFYLIFVFVLFFQNYESIVSKIFDTKKRDFHRMFLLYIGFLILFPSIFILFALILSSSDINSYISNTAVLFIWLLFYISFKFSVNIKISNKASIVGSLATLLAIGFTKKIFLLYVQYNTTYNTIYGSFSVILISLLWIYLSWSIYLYGLKTTAILNQKFLRNKYV